MSYRIVPAIMSGGRGTRLWPASTGDRPKQFLALFGPSTLFDETLARVTGRAGQITFAPPLILGDVIHRDLIESSLARAGIDAGAIALEPQPRNTAAAGAIAAALASDLSPDALVLLLPADHIVSDVAAYHDAIARAAPFAATHIVTFGIAPSRAAIEYGYIRLGAPLGDGVHEIRSFHEKPSSEKAAEYFKNGEYAWNAGMFLFSPKVMLQEFAGSAAIRDGALAALRHASRDGVRIELCPFHFAAIPAEPLDIAVMEKTLRGAVVPCSIGWADVGSWDEVWRHSPKDNAGNVMSGPVAIREASNSLVHSDGARVFVSGVDNLIVIATRESIIVLPRERAQEVKHLQEAMLKKE